MRNIKVQIAFGANSVNFTFPEGSTASAVVRDNRVQAALGYGDNVQAVINGVVLQDRTPVEDGDSITVETKANQKA